MRRCATIPILVGLLVPCAARGESPAPVTRVTVESFSVGLAPGEGLAFVREEGELRDGVNPDVRARALGRGETTLLHSTSWRWEPDGRIVLTYLAWTRDGTLPSDARRLPRLPPPAPTDPLHPRPAEIRELDPLAHGLRHLGFLLATSRDGALAAALGPKGVAALSAMEADVGGELPR